MQATSQTNALYEVGPSSFVSDWHTFPNATDVTIMTSVSGERSAGLLYVERESDGQTFDLELLNPDQSQGMASSMYTFLSGDQGRYRFVLRPSDEDVEAVRDVEIITPQNGSLAKHAIGSKYAGIIDLKTMNSVQPDTSRVFVFPNPSRGRVSIAVDLRHDRSQATNSNRRNVEVYILDQMGSEVLTMQCMETDLLHVDVDQLPQGVYNVLVRSNVDRKKHFAAPFVLLK